MEQPERINSLNEETLEANLGKTVIFGLVTNENVGVYQEQEVEITARIREGKWLLRASNDFFVFEERAGGRWQLFKPFQK